MPKGGIYYGIKWQFDVLMSCLFSLNSKQASAYTSTTQEHFSDFQADILILFFFYFLFWSLNKRQKSMYDFFRYWIFYFIFLGPEFIFYLSFFRLVKILTSATHAKHLCHFNVCGFWVKIFLSQTKITYNAFFPLFLLNQDHTVISVNLDIFFS